MTDLSCVNINCLMQGITPINMVVKSMHTKHQNLFIHNIQVVKLSLSVPSLLLKLCLYPVRWYFVASSAASLFFVETHIHYFSWVHNTFSFKCNSMQSLNIFVGCYSSRHILSETYLFLGRPTISETFPFVTKSNVLSLSYFNLSPTFCLYFFFHS